MIPTGSPRRILSLTSSKKGSAEQGDGEEPLEAATFDCVFIGLFRFYRSLILGVRQIIHGGGSLGSIRKFGTSRGTRGTDLT